MEMAKIHGIKITFCTKAASICYIVTDFIESKTLFVQQISKECVIVSIEYYFKNSLTAESLDMS